MLLPLLAPIVHLIFASAIVQASPTLHPDLLVRTPPGRTPQDVVQAVRRGIGAAANGSQPFRWEGHTTLDRSWDGAVLLQLQVSPRKAAPDQAANTP